MSQFLPLNYKPQPYLGHEGIDPAHPGKQMDFFFFKPGFRMMLFTPKLIYHRATEPQGFSLGTCVHLFVVEPLSLSFLHFEQSIPTEKTRHMVTKLHHARNKLRSLELPRREKPGKTQSIKNKTDSGQGQPWLPEGPWMTSKCSEKTICSFKLDNQPNC